MEHYTVLSACVGPCAFHCPLPPFPEPCSLVGRWACPPTHGCDLAVLASRCLTSPPEEGGDSVLSYHHVYENEPHSRLQVELAGRHFSMGTSLRVKPADGWLGQRPKSPDAYPPPTCESGHSGLVVLQSD